MPSDEAIFKALWRPFDAFRSAVAVTIEQVRGQVEDAEADSETDEATTSAELGVFATGRIDMDRFAAVAAREKVDLAPGAVECMRKSLDTLRALAERKEDLLRIRIEQGGDLVATLRAALAEVGRAFGAARAVELSRRGSWKDAEHGAWLAAFPYEAWNGAERGLAPPFVVTVDGADLRADGLAALLDGALKIVLLVEGDAPPAPLARLISPGVYVAQVEDAEQGLERLGAWDGPGVAAVMPSGAAVWSHDPDAGPGLQDRLKVERVPDLYPTKALGGISAFQQTEPLRQLKALAAGPAAAAATAPAALPGGDPVDRLAAWLMAEADLQGLDEE